MNPRVLDTLIAPSSGHGGVSLPRAEFHMGLAGPTSFNLDATLSDEMRIESGLFEDDDEIQVE